jgi:hypothetical protein
MFKQKVLFVKDDSVPNLQNREKPKFELRKGKFDKVDRLLSNKNVILINDTSSSGEEDYRQDFEYTGRNPLKHNNFGILDKYKKSL